MKLKIAASALLFSLAAQATVVEFRTVLGNVQVNLFDEETPETVANFLEYVNSGAYANNVIHRSDPDFVLQGGGFQYNNMLPLDVVPKGAPVVNEPELSNVSGTLAMAKLDGNPDSATSQWFFNLADNSQNLDVQNGGFTVFGQVIGDGMTIIETISALPRFNMGGAANSMPLRNYSEADASSGVEPDEDNLVLITDIVVVDSAPATNPDLVPVKNTLITSTPSTPPVTGGGSQSSGGGATGAGLLALLLFGAHRLRKNAVIASAGN